MGLMEKSMVLGMFSPLCSIFEACLGTRVVYWRHPCVQCKRRALHANITIHHANSTQPVSSADRWLSNDGGGFLFSSHS